LVEKQNFAEFAGEFARDYFGKCHEAGLRVWRHGEAVLEGPSTVSSADPGAEDEGVAAVEGDGLNIIIRPLFLKPKLLIDP
jgi:hypothetical protein